MQYVHKDPHPLLNFRTNTNKSMSFRECLYDRRTWFLCIRILHELPNNKEFWEGEWLEWDGEGAGQHAASTNPYRVVGLPNFKAFVKEEQQHHLESLTQPYPWIAVSQNTYLSSNYDRLPLRTGLALTPVNCVIVFLILCRLKKVPLYKSGTVNDP